MSRSAPLCDDWLCPAGASCALAFWRSKEYAEMAGAGELKRRAREPGKDACTEYRFDKPKKWLMSAAELGAMDSQGVA